MIRDCAQFLCALALGLIWWAAFLRHAPRPSDTAAIAARRLRELR
ncbi:hypothetical protein [Methylobacterium fujisawaense]